MSIELKVKALSLAAESTIIKNQEQKFKRKAKKYYDYQGTRIQQKIEALVAKINTLDEKAFETERRIMFTWLTQLRTRLHMHNLAMLTWQPSKEQADKFNATRTSLERHRIDVVRVEARATHIARGYLSGKTYLQMEGLSNLLNAANNGVQWDRVRAMVIKYGSNQAVNNFDAWLLNIGVVREIKTIESSNKPARTYSVYKKAA